MLSRPYLTPPPTPPTHVHRTSEAKVLACTWHVQVSVCVCDFVVGLSTCVINAYRASVFFLKTAFLLCNQKGESSFAIVVQRDVFLKSKRQEEKGLFHIVYCTLHSEQPWLSYFSLQIVKNILHCSYMVTSSTGNLTFYWKKLLESAWSTAWILDQFFKPTSQCCTYSCNKIIQNEG